MTAPAALILGAAVWPDGPSPTLRRRTLHAAQLWHAGAVGRLIACGGLGRHPPTEAEAMAALLHEAGVPAEAIALEDRSTTTAGNIRRALPLLARIGTSEAVIVTDRWHAPRALLVARCCGLSARADCPPLSGGSARQVLRSTLREVPAYAAYLVGLRGRD